MYAVHEARLPAKNPRLHERSLTASRHRNDRARIFWQSGKKLEILVRGFFSNGRKSAKSPLRIMAFTNGARPNLTHAKLAFGIAQGGLIKANLTVPILAHLGLRRIF